MDRIEEEQNLARLMDRLANQIKEINGLFMLGNQPGILPRWRIEDAKQKLQEAKKILETRPTPKKLEYHFILLRAACEEAEKRMKRFENTIKIKESGGGI